MATNQAEHPELPPLRPTTVTETQLSRRSRRSFIGGTIFAAAAYGSWRWLRTRSMIEDAAWPIRKVLDGNGRIARELFSSRRGEEYTPDTAPQGPRTNGNLGLQSNINLVQWRLNVKGIAADGGHTELTLADIQALPKVRTTMRLCCIEGWSILVNWGGCRFIDFATKYAPGRSFDYVGMSTPDGQYYVGLDAPAAIHPQTLLCYEIDDKPLTFEHGAPLRLVAPSKYGVKNLKRIGTIDFTNQRPADYWAEQGYDWYAGL